MKSSVLLLLLPLLGHAQNAKIDRWSFNMGQGLPANSGTVLASLVGEPGTGAMRGGNAILTWRYFSDSMSRAVIVAVPAGNGELPLSYELDQNFPNPFNPTTQLGWEMPERGWVSLRIYDLLGRQVATLVEGMEEAGKHTVRFNAASVSSGVYLYRLVVRAVGGRTSSLSQTRRNDFTAVRKMILLR
jgi:hypothetical protein